MEINLFKTIGYMIKSDPGLIVVEEDTGWRLF
jgi:hypothetical protein